jgi:hypothetical protein
MAGCISNLPRRVVEPSGFQPEFQISENCVLCIERWPAKWYARWDSNPEVSWFVARYPDPLNDGRVINFGWPPRPRTWNLPGQSRMLRQLS